MCLQLYEAYSLLHYTSYEGTAARSIRMGHL